MQLEEYNAVDINFIKLLAEKVAKMVKSSDVIALHGELGVGKTIFTKFFINALLPNEIVSSPTFNIINYYCGNDLIIWHLDLYRIKSLPELYEIGIEEVLKLGIVIVEWPELIKKLTIPNIEITINYNSSNCNLRDVIIQIFNNT